MILKPWLSMTAANNERHHRYITYMTEHLGASQYAYAGMAAVVLAEQPASCNAGHRQDKL